MKPTNRRRYFTEGELAKLISAARKGRYGQRDATLILIMACGLVRRLILSGIKSTSPGRTFMCVD